MKVWWELCEECCETSVDTWRTTHDDRLERSMNPTSVDTKTELFYVYACGHRWLLLLALKLSVVL